MAPRALAVSGVMSGALAAGAAWAVSFGAASGLSVGGAAWAAATPSKATTARAENIRRMTWNVIVVQEESCHLLTDLGVPVKRFRDNYFTADAVAATTTLASAACLAGVKVFNCLSVEDVVLREVDGAKRVTGLVINSSPVEMAGLHVDPVVVGCRYLIEATGHPVEVLKTLVRKNDIRLATPSGGIQGEQSMAG